MPDESAVRDLNLPVVGDNPGTTPGSATAGRDQDGKQPDPSGSVQSMESGSKPLQPFILSEGLAPTPAKLVDKIVRGEFVDTAELL